jgi:ESS family glutamate:Na+ symporter
LKIWELTNLALPLIILLLAQTVLMAIYAYTVSFKVMGSNYDSAVIAAGFCGFGMGAVANGMANMAAVTEKYTYSRLAYFVIPIVGSLFIDFFNVIFITATLAFI